MNQVKQKSSQPELRARSQQRSDGRIVYVVGFTGSGKTTWTAQQVAHEPRLLVWDGKAEWHKFRCKVITSPRELLPHVLPGAPPSRIAYRVPVSRESFAAFCKLAWVYCRAHGAPVVAEELADVTTSSKAPVEWGEIVRKSRGFGADVYALTQRPQEVDKTVQGNAALYHCGMMADDMDAAYIARRLLNLPVEQVKALKPMQYIERDVRKQVITRGTTRHSSRK